MDFEDSHDKKDHFTDPILLGNKNAKGLLQILFPKGYNYAPDTDEELAEAVSLINTALTYASGVGLDHYRFKPGGKQRVKGVYHIQNVNNYHS